ncbi:hypothetical protein M2480_002510, partial [Parabacteroides sp. PFB2-12]|uniref:hypothetical protein n=1 Tax=Parabacteroides sp. PFB2-12 TaxID=2940652 RepID=UPI0024768C1A
MVGRNRLFFAWVTWVVYSSWRGEGGKEKGEGRREKGEVGTDGIGVYIQIGGNWKVSTERCKRDSTQPMGDRREPWVSEYNNNGVLNRRSALAKERLYTQIPN